MPESTTALEADPGAYHQIHFAWAEPTLLGRVGPGPAATSLPDQDQPVLRSWRDRLIPALTADYRAALPDTDPAALPETLWAHHYPDGQSALVYRWPGGVREAHAWAIVGPTRGLDLPRVLALHENPHTRPAASRPPAPGWATMRTLPAPEPWERTAAPGAPRTRDRRAAETLIGGEPLLVGAVARALAHPDRPLHLALDPDRADLWQAVQLRFLWGVHRTLHEVLTPRAALPAAGWNWSFSTYDPALGGEGGPHLAFAPPSAAPTEGTPFLSPLPREYLRVAERLAALLREEGGEALADHLGERGVPEAATFGERRALLRDWLDPVSRTPSGTGDPEEAPDSEAVTAPEPEPDLQTPSVTEPPHGDAPAPEPAPGAIEPARTDGAPSRSDVLTDAEAAASAPEPETVLAEAPDPFAEDDSQDTADQETWAGRSGGSGAPRGRTFLGVARRPSPPGPERERAIRERATDPPAALGSPDTAWSAGDGPARPPLLPGPGFRDEAPPGPAASPTSEPATDTAPEIHPSPTSEPPAPAHSPEPPAPAPRSDSATPPPPRAPLTAPSETRAPEEAPPLGVRTVGDHGTDDYAAETEPEPDEDVDAPEDNWPTQYVDLPLSRLERWHAKRGPEGARVDIVDARAAVRAERAELQRVRDERDRYHTEVQDLRREIVRLDQSWIDTEPLDEAPAPRRRWPLVLLALALLALALVAGLEVGSATGSGVLGLLALTD
ncbi:hypothetical protein ABZ635_12950 [Nocardiopsis sp. NPDC007018]|uniref:hypothetical protein n=1 Tax=Nocardiopsis sp. NPDC007018 TaxID=3155721 RepID=UPI0033D0166C